MSNVVKYNTEEMREWANSVLKSNDSYYDNVTSLFTEVENFIGTGFTGDLADDFLASFQDKKKYFIENKDVIEECGQLISKRADKIDSDEQELMNKVKNENYFN